jgi:hypothetical protein
VEVARRLREKQETIFDLYRASSSYDTEQYMYPKTANRQVAQKLGNLDDNENAYNKPFFVTQNFFLK